MRYYLPRLAIFALLTLLLWLARGQAEANPQIYVFLVILMFAGAAYGVTQRD